MEKDYDELKKAFDALKRIHESMNHAFTSQQTELERLKNQVNILTIEKKAWEVQKEQQQMIIQQSLSQSNMMSNQYLEENQRLKAELKRLKNS